MTQPTQYPLRERRKRRTRNALIRASMELFDEQGYDSTTLEQVAERAEVHVQTLYRHFPSKEALAIAPDTVSFEHFRDAVVDRDCDTLTFWRNWVADMAADTDQHHHDTFLRRAQGRERSPSLSAAHIALWHQYEDILTAELAKDCGVDPKVELLPRLIACMIWGGNHNAVREWASNNGTTDLTQDTLEVVDRIIELFGHQVGTPGKRRQR